MSDGWQWLFGDDILSANLRIGIATSRRDRAISTVVVSGRTALLVDPNWDPDELARIADDLTSAGIAVTAGFATHAHHDHLLWHPRLGQAQRWASTVTAQRAALNRANLIAALGSTWPAELAELVGQVTGTDASQLTWAGPSVELLTHDAHAKGHTALWIPATATLIAGDMLSDVELPLLEESSPGEYADGLTRLRPFVDRALLVIPGHGSPAVGAAAARARWAADNRYLASLVGRTDPIDRRIELPGMREAHAHNRSRLAG